VQNAMPTLAKPIHTNLYTYNLYLSMTKLSAGCGVVYLPILNNKTITIKNRCATRVKHIENNNY